MPSLPLISAVVPAFNPEPFLEETLASIEAQSYPHWEAIVVDDGSDRPESLAILKRIEKRNDPRIRVIRQANAGAAAARNAGFRAANAAYIVPIDDDDLLEPEMMTACVKELVAHPEAGFVYFDYRVFGNSNYIERPGEFDLYRLTRENFLPSCCMMMRSTWEQAGGYDEWHRWSYEDWSLFLAIGKRGFHGRYLPQPLYCYRRHASGLHEVGLERHEANWAHMREVHADLLVGEGRLELKRRSAPSICVVATSGRPPDLSNQTLRDFQTVEAKDEATALNASSADAFLWLAGDQPLQPRALEECVWALSEADWVSWRDTGDAPPPSLARCAGPLGVSRAAMGQPEPKQSGVVRRLPWKCRTSKGARSVPSDHAADDENPAARQTVTASESTGAIGTIRRHLENAELLSAEAWLRHPMRSTVRLIPLRWKERINQAAGRRVFDLSFYLKFQPRSVLAAGKLIEPLEYIVRPAAAGKKRLALITPHLGVGGAESVLLELAGQADRDRFETILIAAHSQDRRLKSRWAGTVDWIVDSEQLVDTESVSRLLLSTLLAWEVDLVVLQNAPAAYSILPALKEKLPGVKTADILHAVDEQWDLFSATADVEEHLDRRVVISEQGRRRLGDLATPDEKVRLIPNGVDLRRFDPKRFDPSAERARLGIQEDSAMLLFLGRLDAVKRPLLLLDVKRELRRLAPKLRPMFVVAGDGPEGNALRTKIDGQRLRASFRLLGHVDDPGPLLGAADLLLIPSRGEGVPLAALESMAMKTPVIATRAGAMAEAVAADRGALVDPGAYEETRIAQSVADLLTDREALHEAGSKGRQFVERKHSLDEARREYAALLHELAGPDDPSPDFSPPDDQST